MVRAKFKVSSIGRSMGQKYDEGRYVPSEVWTIHLYPVTSGADQTDDNKMFWAATPNGKIELTCVNKHAVEQFDLDREFYVDFTPVIND